MAYSCINLVRFDFKIMGVWNLLTGKLHEMGLNFDYFRDDCHVIVLSNHRYIREYR